MRTPAATLLEFHPVSPLAGGERVAPLLLDRSEGRAVVGRTSSADWTIPDMTVSRTHAAVEAHGGGWLVRDLGSRHGTWVNGVRLGEGEVMPLRGGDEVRFGRWACRCQIGASATTNRISTMPDRGPGSRVTPIAQGRLEGVAQQRLEALIGASRELERAADREGVARTLVEHAGAGTGCARVLVLRAAGRDEYEVVANSEAADSARLSRTLLEAAAAGEVVQLSGEAGGFQAAQSMIDLGIRSAICAPMMIGGAADSFLYLDTRGSEGTLAADVASFCSALAQLGAMATERLAAAEMRARREQMERDLAGARRAQQLLMPARSGTRPGLSYCFESTPGRFVAGDLFDLVPLAHGRTAFFLGDVSGKGVGAGLLMASAQTQLRTLLLRGVPLVEAVMSLNEHVHERTEPGTFLTLIAGVYDPMAARVELCDAGHGLCCRCGESGAERVVLDGGVPIGVASGERYPAEEVELRPGQRLVLLSDGVVEQPSLEGTQFGLESVLRCLRPEADPGADVATLLTAVQTHAAGPFADDFTVVSLAATHL